MINDYYILYCEFTGSYVYQEREDCWQYSNQDFATKFDSLDEAEQIKTKLETEGFPPLTVFKMRQTTEVVDALQ